MMKKNNNIAFARASSSSSSLNDRDNELSSLLRSHAHKIIDEKWRASRTQENIAIIFARASFTFARIISVEKDDQIK